MRRIESSNVPAITRKMLRERFAWFLPVDSVVAIDSIPVANPPVSDKELVALYLHLDFVPGNDVSRARELYLQATKGEQPPESTMRPKGNGSLDLASGQSEVGTASEALPPPLSGVRVLPPVEVENASEPTADAGSPESATDSVEQFRALALSAQIFAVSPSFDGLSLNLTFDELIQLGWIRTSWGRFYVPGAIRMALLHNPRVGGAFRCIFEQRHQDAFKLAQGFTPTGQLHELAADLVSRKYGPYDIACISRPWIAARLWDTKLDSESTETDAYAEERLSRWVDWWAQLGAPSFAMSSYVDPTAFDEFVDVAMKVLEASTTMPGWLEFAKAAVTPTILLYPHRAEDLVDTAIQAPVAIVDRVSWMQRGAPEEAVHEYFESKGSDLLLVLLNELHDAVQYPRQLVHRLMNFVVERPAALMRLVHSARSAPALLADMLMAPPTCVLACSLIASWQFNGDGWNRAFRANADEATELLAFEDALSLLGGHIDEGNVPATELAALYLHIYELATNTNRSSHRYTYLSLLRQELASADRGLQDAVVAALASYPPNESKQNNSFFAALDLAAEGGCADRIAAEHIVSLYLDSVLPLGERLRGAQLDSTTAQVLATLALRCDEVVRNRFVKAVDVAGWLKLAPSSPVENDFAFRDLLARRVRLHIRVVARAISAWPAETPSSLVDALAHAIRVGATDNLRRGRVDAFVPSMGFGHIWAEEHPIALDLAAALGRLTGDSQQQVLTELCQVEEPIVLAGIVSNTPAAIHARVKQHLATLTPKTSPEVWSLPALQARVEALLSAGMVETAEPFIAAERDAKTFGPVPGREVSALRANLLMLLLREDWDSLNSYVLPDNLSAASRLEAEDVLLFYRGVTQLKKLDGNLEEAERIFADLTQRHPDVTSYPLNLFATRVQQLLGSNAFGQLSGEALTKARRYLTEAKQETRPRIQHSVADVKTLDSNRAMLLLAAGRPQESLQVSLALREYSFDAYTEGFRALAMARLGSKREALAVLTQAERIFGRTELLSAIRENIDRHVPYVTAPSLSMDDDPVPGIRQALAAFARLGHAEQAEALHPHGRLDLYLLDEIRGACSSIVALAPMMKTLGMLHKEDDISSVLKHILRSRLLIAQWAVEDQSRGGFSKSGGVGERDLIVSKGAATLAVIEALIVDSVEAGNLTSHFNKLLGYDTCRFFFHITYARGANCARVLGHLRKACTTPPSGINYGHSEELADVDSSPAGFKAYYEIGSRPVIVTFLVLEMAQPVQRAAAGMQ